MWSDDSGGYENVTITLRPLHDRRLSGYLAAEVGPYLVEFRLRDRWDAGIPRSAVIVHRFEDNRSYLMPAVGGGQDLIKGDRFEHGNPLLTVIDHYSVRVIDIDESQKKATIQVTYRPRQIPHVDQPIPRFFYVHEVAGLWIKGSFFPVPPQALYAQLEDVSGTPPGFDVHREHKR